MNKTTSLVIGMGEIGVAIQKAFECDGLGKFKHLGRSYDIIHICFPYSDDFIDEVKRYQKLASPKYTVIHSTVPVGTSRKCGAIHSPVRGIHPNLYGGTMKIEKMIGGKDASAVADEFRRKGMRVVLFDTPEETELGKLMSTEYFRACIEHCHRVKRLCDKHKVPFHSAYTVFNKSYNEGYLNLGHPEFVRPTLQPIMKKIGGHCVLPNKKILEDAGDI